MVIKVEDSGKAHGKNSSDTSNNLIHRTLLSLLLLYLFNTIKTEIVVPNQIKFGFVTTQMSKMLFVQV